MTGVNLAGCTITVRTSVSPEPPIREELATNNGVIQSIAFTVGVDTDGDQIIDVSDLCVTVPEDIDSIFDLDGCPDVDAIVSGASAGAAITSYVGFPTVQTVSFNVANSTLDGAASASVNIAGNLNVTGNTAPATATITPSIGWNSGVLATGTSVTINSKSLNITCTGVGSGTVSVQAIRTGMTPAGTLDEPGTVGNESSLAAVSVNCLKDDPAAGALTVGPPISLSAVFTPPLGSGGSASTGISEIALNNSEGPTQTITSMNLTWTITAPAGVTATWLSSGTTTAVKTTGAIASLGASALLTDTLNITCTASGSFSVGITSTITSVTGVVQLATDSNIPNNTELASVPVTCSLDTDGDGFLDISDPTPDHDIVASTQIVSGPGPVSNAAGTPTQMWAQYNITNARSHTDNTSSALTIGGFPAVCTKTGDATPFLPPTALLALLGGQTRTVVWKVDMTGAAGCATGLHTLTITTAVDHLLVAGDGDETLAQQANNSLSSTKGFQVNP